MTTVLPAPATAPSTPAPRLRLVRYEPDADETPAVGRPRPMATPAAPTPLPEPPDDVIRQRVQQVLRLILEVLDGRRPVAQLGPHVDPSTLRYLRAAGRRGSGPSRLTSLRMCRPRLDAVEVAAVYRIDGRARALAARFERLHDRPGSWQCVALRLG